MSELKDWIKIENKGFGRQINFSPFIPSTENTTGGFSMKVAELDYVFLSESGAKEIYNHLKNHFECAS